MPSITDHPPADIASELSTLRQALDASAIPAKRLDSNLLIATWNLRAFGGLTEKWRSGASDSPKRDLLSLLSIGEIASRFDVIALQEVKRNTKALRVMMEWLNRDAANWGVMVTDVTRGDVGNKERLAFVYDTRRVKPSGLACELVVPEREGIDAGAFTKQFARTPYAVGFEAGRLSFILVTLHVVWGKELEQRTSELKEIATWLREWVLDPHVWDSDVIALGDFNTDRRSDPRYCAFMSTGLWVPDELHQVPRTLFGSSTSKHYDQIAWFPEDDGVPGLSMQYAGAAGNFDFQPVVFDGLTRLSKSWRISDHYPLWVEFSTPRV